MSERPNAPQGVSSHGTPIHSEPHMGDGIGYEGVDAPAALIVRSLAIIGISLLLVFLITVPIQRYLQRRNPPGQLPSAIAPERVVPPSPQIQVHPWEELPDLRAREDQVLNNYGKDAAGHVHIPIARAMDAVVSRLSIRPGSPQGITTPGGEGRDFAGSVNAMPAPYLKPQIPYLKPQIQGEIQKHAQ